MNIHLPLLGVSIFALSSFALAQDPTPPKPAPAPAPTPVRPPAQNEPRIHPLGDVIGLEITGLDKKSLGKVDDLLLDSADGSIDYVVIGQGGVLGVGEDKYLVPFESILFGRPDTTTKDDDLNVTTALTEERIKKAPKLGKEQHIGPDVERAIREAAGLSPTPMQPRAENSDLVLAKRVKGAEVLGATQEKLGALDDVIVDPRAGVVAYDVLIIGGNLGNPEKRYAMPWEVTHLRPNTEFKPVFTSDLTKENLGKAPEYDPKDLKRVTSTTYLRDVYAYYLLEPYFSRTTHASAPRDPKPAEKKKDGK